MVLGFGGHVGRNHGQQAGEAVLVVDEAVAERGLRRGPARAEDQIDVGNLVAVSNQGLSHTDICDSHRYLLYAVVVPAAPRAGRAATRFPLSWRRLPASSVATVKSALVPGLMRRLFRLRSKLARSLGVHFGRFRRIEAFDEPQRFEPNPPRGDAAEFTLYVRVLEACEEREVERHHRPRSRPPNPAPRERRESEIEDVLESACILACDPIAILGLAHHREQACRGGTSDIMTPALAEPRRLGQANRREHPLRVVDGRLLENPVEPGSKGTDSDRRRAPPARAGRTAARFRGWCCSPSPLAWLRCCRAPVPPARDRGCRARPRCGVRSPRNRPPSFRVRPKRSSRFRASAPPAPRCRRATPRPRRDWELRTWAARQTAAAKGPLQQVAVEPPGVEGPAAARAPSPTPGPD